MASLLITGLWMSGADWRGLLLFAVIVTVAAWAPFGATHSKASPSLGRERQNTQAGVRTRSTRYVSSDTKS